MISRRMPDASRPGPSGPDLFSPTGGSLPRAARASGNMSRAGARPPGSRRLAGLALRVPRLWPRTLQHPACAHPCELRLRPARRHGRHLYTPHRAVPDEATTNLSSDVQLATSKCACSGDRASRGRESPGTLVSYNPITRSAQSAAQTAAIRRSGSLNVWGSHTQILPIETPAFSSRRARQEKRRRPCLERNS